MKYSHAIYLLLIGILTLWSCAKPHSQLYTVMEDRQYKTRLYDDFVNNCTFSQKYYSKNLRKNSIFTSLTSQFSNTTSLYLAQKQYVRECAHQFISKGEECDLKSRTFLNDTPDCNQAKEKILENKILLYRTDLLPASLSDKFDYRERELLEKDDRINIVVEKVHLGTNGDTVSNGEVAVVVSVVDGNENMSSEQKAGEKSKDVIVYFSKGIPKGFDLPFSSLLAYTGDYGNQPIIVKILVIDIDELLFERFNKILNLAANMGNNLSPAYAEATSLAVEIGKLVLEAASENDVIAEFQFPLYPKMDGEGLNRRYYNQSPGLTIASTGRYLILSTEDENNCSSEPCEFKEKIYTQESFYLDSNSNLYYITPNNMNRLFKKYTSTSEDKPMRISAKELEIGKYRIDKGISYAILSIDRRRLPGADRIIQRLDGINRELKKELTSSRNEEGIWDSVINQTEKKYEFFKKIKEYEDDYSSRWRFIKLMKSYDALTDKSEKEYLLNYVQNRINFDQKEIANNIVDTDNMSQIRAYFEKESKLSYDKRSRKFALPE